MNFDDSNTPEEVVEEEQVSDIDDFIKAEEEENQDWDPSRVITFKTQAGQSAYAPVPEGEILNLIQAKIASGLTFTPSCIFFMNSAQITDETPVPGGSTVSVVGSVKGGLQ